MFENKFPYRTKSIFFFLALSFNAVFAFLSLFFVMKEHLTYLSYMLYDRSHLSAVYRLSRILVTKLILAVIFFLVAVILLYIFYFSYYQLLYLQLAVFCFCMISYITSFQEIEIMFYSSPEAMLHWQNAGLISFLLLCFSIITVTFDFFLKKASFLWILIPAFVLLLFFGLFAFHRYSWSCRVLPAAAILLIFYSILLICASLVRKEHRNVMFSLIPLTFLYFLIYANLVFRKKIYQIPDLNRKQLIYSYSLYIAVGVVTLLLILTLAGNRNFLMHSRSLNRNVMELEQSKHMLLGIIYSNIKNYLFSAGNALESITGSTWFPASEESTARRLKTELSNIDTLYTQIHNYTFYSGNMLELAPCHVNMDLFFHSLKEKLAYSGLLLPSDRVELMEGCGYADFIPESFLHSCEYLIHQLKEADPQSTLLMQTDSQEGKVTLQFILQNTKRNISSGNMHSYLHFLRHPEYDLAPDLSSIDFTISTIRNQIHAYGGCIKFQFGQDSRLLISFPRSGDGALPSQKEIVECRDSESGGLASILVLSTDPGQMKEIRSILPTDKYSFVLSNDASFYVRNYQELRDFSLIIVGKLYREIYFRDFYDCIRKHYSMTELPILMLLPDLYAENSFYIRSTVNDYLIPPYSQVSLEKKTHSLLEMKRTADRELEVQFAFWQSQINPHFIFNSINSIMQMCIDQPMKAYELLDDFSEYLRGHLLSVSLDQISTIQKEIDLISAYLKIERARFGDKIQYEMDIDCRKDFPILPLLIEPLIENSIKHSSMRESGVRISLQIYQMENQLLVRIEDNGNGINQRIVEQITKGTYHSNSVGLMNVCSRLQHYYRVTPLIESTPGEGTVVQFTIIDRAEGVKSHAENPDR